MAREKPALAAVLAAMCSVACNAGSAERGAAGGAAGASGAPAIGGSGGEAGDDGVALGACFDVNLAESSCERWPPGPPAALFEASSIDPGARFIASGGEAVLAEWPEGSSSRWAVAWLAPPGSGIGPGSDWNVTIVPVEWPEAQAAGRVLDVWAPVELEPDEPRRIAALGCDDRGCTVLAGSDEEPSLRPAAGYALPAGAAVEGLAYGNRLCAFGDGLYCRNGDAWVAEIPPGTVDRFVSVVPRAFRSAAVTATGSLFVQEGDTWQEVEGSERFTAVASAADGSYASMQAFGDSGLWWYRAGTADDQTTTTCTQTPPIVFAASRTLIFDSSGAGYYHQATTATGDGWCRLQPLPDVLEMSAFSCGITRNVIAFSEATLFSLLGPGGCAIE